MLVLAASLLTAITLAGLVLTAQFGLYAAFFSKPIIDATWDSYLAGVSLLHIVGVLFPTIVLLKSIFNKYTIAAMPLFWLWIIYCAYSALTFSGIAFQDSLESWVDLTFRVLNGLAGYYAVQAYVSDPKRLKTFLAVLIAAGIFPMSIGVYQIFTGVVWRENVTGELIRNIGLYHDAVAIRSFAFQTLAAIFLYLAYFCPSAAAVKRFLLISFAFVVVIVQYRAYSKAATVIILLWLLIWAVSFRRILKTTFLIFAGCVIAAIYYDEIAADITELFSKEITAAESENVDAWTLQRTLTGRGFSWYGAIDHFSQRSFFEQMFGDGNPANIHNDYLAKLLAGGVVGLLIYLGLLIAMGMRLIANWHRRRTPLDVMGVMVFVMLLIDSMGIHVTLYTSYQWFAWGIIGLALRGVEVPAPAKRAVAGRPVGLLQRSK